MITCWQRVRSIARDKTLTNSVARFQVILSLIRSAGMCRFLLCEGWCEESQQLYQFLAFISQRMLKPNGDCDYLSISNRHLRLIQCQDRFPTNDPDCFVLLRVMVTTNLPARWDLDDIDIRVRVIRCSQEALKGNIRKAWMLLPVFSFEARDARESHQSISIPPHTFSDWPDRKSTR